MHGSHRFEIERIEKNIRIPLKEDAFSHCSIISGTSFRGGPMTGIGNNFQVASLSNCFVIGHKHPADSYGGIFHMDEEQVQLMKRHRGGVGHDLSHPPYGQPGAELGPYVDGYRALHMGVIRTRRLVAQDGRRGALMLSLSIKRPDAERFIDAKVDTGKVTGANVSIKIDDEFMRAALAGRGSTTSSFRSVGQSQIRTGHRR